MWNLCKLHNTYFFLGEKLEEEKKLTRTEEKKIEVSEYYKFYGAKY